MHVKEINRESDWKDYYVDAGGTTVNLIDPHFGKPVDFRGDSGFGKIIEFHGDRDFGIDVPNIEDVVTPQDDNYLIIK